MSSVVALLASWRIPGWAREVGALVPDASTSPLVAPASVLTVAQVAQLYAQARCCRKLVSMCSTPEHKEQMWAQFPWIVLNKWRPECNPGCSKRRNREHDCLQYFAFNSETGTCGPLFDSSSEAEAWWRRWRAENTPGEPQGLQAWREFREKENWIEPSWQHTKYETDTAADFDEDDSVADDEDDDPKGWRADWELEERAWKAGRSIAAQAQFEHQQFMAQPQEYERKNKEQK